MTLLVLGGLLGSAAVWSAALLPSELPTGWTTGSSAEFSANPSTDLFTAVGRLSRLQGDVRWYDRDSKTWLGTLQQPLRNWPLSAGDHLRTGADGRAELQVGRATLRLGADVDLRLQRLDERGLVLFLQSGSVALRLSDAEPGESVTTEVITSEGRWLPSQPGHYRFDRQPDATQATAWRGELRFEGGNSVLQLRAGQRADLWRDASDGLPRYAWAEVERDAFADWVARDERFDEAPITASRVPPGVSDWQELERHGDWRVHPEFGEVWLPREVAGDWAPFQNGRWAWVAPGGWTWIDAAPWGFAPFHYGRWVVWQGRWCWSPGPRGHRARYAPALSAWIAAPQPGDGRGRRPGHETGPGFGDRPGGGEHRGVRPPPPRLVVPRPEPIPPRFVPPPAAPVVPGAGDFLHQLERPPVVVPRGPARQERMVAPGLAPDRSGGRERFDGRERRDWPEPSSGAPRDPERSERGQDHRREGRPALNPLPPGVAAGLPIGPSRGAGPLPLPAAPAAPATPATPATPAAGLAGYPGSRPVTSPLPAAGAVMPRPDHAAVAPPAMIPTPAPPPAVNLPAPPALLNRPPDRLARPGPGLGPRPDVRPETRPEPRPDGRDARPDGRDARRAVP